MNDRLCVKNTRFYALLQAVPNFESSAQKKSGTFLPRSSKKQILLQGNLCADFLEGLLQSLSLFLGDAGLHHLRCAVNQLLCLLQAKGSCLTDNLDDLNLVCADLGELDIKLGLLLLRCWMR